MKNKIIIKGGIIKGWYFEPDFYNCNVEQVEHLERLFNEIYEGACSVYAAKEKNADNTEMKQRLCSILDWFFDNGIIIENGFDNRLYKSKKAYHDYILDYGRA